MSPKETRMILVTKSLVFMRFSFISINLLEFFRIMSFVFEIKYLSQNSINFNMFGVFGILRTSSFQNCPWICILNNIWRRYWGFSTAKGPVCQHCISAYSNAYDIRSHFHSVLLISATKNIVYGHEKWRKSFSLWLKSLYVWTH